MSFALSVAFASFHLERNQLGTTEMFHDFAFDFSAFHERSAEPDLGTFSERENFIECNFLSGSTFETFHRNDILLLDLELFATAGNHCVHGKLLHCFMLIFISVSKKILPKPFNIIRQ